MWRRFHWKHYQDMLQTRIESVRLRLPSQTGYLAELFLRARESWRRAKILKRLLPIMYAAYPAWQALYEPSEANAAFALSTRQEEGKKKYLRSQRYFFSSHRVALLVCLLLRTKSRVCLAWLIKRPSCRLCRAWPGHQGTVYYADIACIACVIEEKAKSVIWC